MEHKVIPDTERHEVKGASTATPGHFLKCTGADQTSFEPISVSDIPDFPTIPTVPVAALQADSVAEDLPTLVQDFNALLAKLKAAGLMES